MAYLPGARACDPNQEGGFRKEREVHITKHHLVNDNNDLWMCVVTEGKVSLEYSKTIRHAVSHVFGWFKTLRLNELSKHVSKPILGTLHFFFFHATKKSDFARYTDVGVDVG